MKESVAIAKEANRKKESSPTRSDNSILRLQNEHERQLGSLRDVIGNIRRNGGTPSLDSISTELSVMPYSDRAPVLLALQQTHGNRYVQRVVTLARKDNGEAEAVPEVEQAIQRARGSGQALDREVQDQMESAFGADFSGVRIHTDTQANTLNRQLNARAFTTGQDIFFRQGAYNPCSSSGRELLVHELTHVVQQTGKLKHKLTLGQPDDKYEQEADQVARAVMQKEQRVGLQETGEKRVHRQPEEEEEEKELQMRAGIPDRANKIVQRGDDGEEERSTGSGSTFTPVFIRTEEWSAELWDQVWIDEIVGRLSVTYSYGRDRDGRIQIWAPDADVSCNDPLIQFGERVTVSRVGPRIIELEFEFGIGGPGVQVSRSRSEQSGSSVGVTAVPVTMGFTSGTTLAQSYTMSGRGVRSRLKRRYRISREGINLVLQRDIPQDWRVPESNGRGTRYGSFEVRNERTMIIESINLETRSSEPL